MALRKLLLLPRLICIAAGIKPPRHFGDAQLRELFPGEAWETLESGPLTMHGVPLTTTADFEPIPSIYAMVRARIGTPSPLS